MTIEVGVAEDSIDDYSSGVAAVARDTGMGRAEAADASWVDEALAWIREKPPGSRFDADDLRLDLGRSSAVGGVFRAASQRGWIAVVDIVESRSVTRHRGLQRLWERLP